MHAQYFKNRLTTKFSWRGIWGGGGEAGYSIGMPYPVILSTKKQMHGGGSMIGLSLICFLFCLLFYSVILKNLPCYSAQRTNYSLSKTNYSHYSNPILFYIMRIVVYINQCYVYHF